MKIGYLGKRPVTFSYQVAQQIPDTNPEFHGFPTHGDIYDAVASGVVDIGILAIENQLAGTVDECLHAIVQPILTQGKALSGSDTIVRISRELAVPVALYLMNQSGRVEDIKIVKTHPIPMRQAKGWLDRLRKGQSFLSETCASTDAAAEAASADPSVAAISSQAAPNFYTTLKTIDRVDDPIPGAGYDNVTRFWVIERQQGPMELRPRPDSAGTDKICLLFNLERDEAGGLAKSLSVFARENINLAHIYSLPRRDRSWEYTFVLEFEVGQGNLSNVERALELLKQHADYTLIGMYPKYRL